MGIGLAGSERLAPVEAGPDDAGPVDMGAVTLGAVTLGAAYDGNAGKLLDGLFSMRVGAPKVAIGGASFFGASSEGFVFVGFATGAVFAKGSAGLAKGDTAGSFGSGAARSVRSLA